LVKRVAGMTRAAGAPPARRKPQTAGIARLYVIDALHNPCCDGKL
jgi:hypothetical protein